jgi:hypothetical protein
LFGNDVVFFRLAGKLTLGGVAVALSFAVFFVCVLHADFFVHQVLAVHVGDGVVGGFEVGVGDEAVAFGERGFVAGDLGGRDEGAKAGEGVVEGFFVDERVQVADEELGADFDGFLLVGGGLGWVLAAWLLLGGELWDA